MNLSLAANSVNVGLMIGLLHHATSVRIDLNRHQWFMICLSRLLLAHRLQFQPLVLHFQDFLTITSIEETSIRKNVDCARCAIDREVTMMIVRGITPTPKILTLEKDRKHIFYSTLYYNHQKTIAMEQASGFFSFFSIPLVKITPAENWREDWSHLAAYAVRKDRLFSG